MKRNPERARILKQGFFVISAIAAMALAARLSRAACESQARKALKPARCPCRIRQIRHPRS